MLHLTPEFISAKWGVDKIALLALLALSACGVDRDASPDAAPPAADAAIDSPADPPQRQQGGCMGNLPNSRTITINLGDQIPPGIINELQDQNIGAGRKQWSRSVWPRISFGAANVIEAINPASGAFPPVRKITGACTVYFEFDYDQGDVVTGFSFEAYGDGAVDVNQAQLAYGVGMGVGQGVISANLTITNVPAAWTTYTLTSVTPTTLGTGPLSLVLVVNAANFYFGRMIPVFIRP
jgi:hypothetical protein